MGEIMEVVEDLSATSAIGSGISQESAVRRRIAATSATAPGTLQGTVVRTKTLATIATRLVTSAGSAPPSRWSAVGIRNWELTRHVAPQGSFFLPKLWRKFKT